MVVELRCVCGWMSHVFVENRSFTPLHLILSSPPKPPRLTAFHLDRPAVLLSGVSFNRAFHLDRPAVSVSGVTFTQMAFSGPPCRLKRQDVYSDGLPSRPPCRLA